MMNAIIARDSELARKAVGEHIEFVIKQVAKLMRQRLVDNEFPGWPLMFLIRMFLIQMPVNSAAFYKRILV